MASITIRNIPDSILRRIRTLSEIEKRSINSELLILIENGLNKEIETKETGTLILSKESQIKMWESMSGTWEDIRSTEEIIEDIYSHRTKGESGRSMILIDTDICIELLRGNKKVIEKRKEENDTIALSFMTVSELYYGAYKSNKPSHNTSLVEEFILTVNVIQSSLRISKRFGDLKSKLQREGILIEDADIFVAATCLETCEKLITGNIKHYNRIDELKIENWIR